MRRADCFERFEFKRVEMFLGSRAHEAGTSEISIYERNSSSEREVDDQGNGNRGGGRVKRKGSRNEHSESLEGIRY